VEYRVKVSVEVFEGKVAQKPSTTGMVLNGFFGSGKRGVSSMYQKGGFLEHAKMLLVVGGNTHFQDWHHFG